MTEGAGKLDLYLGHRDALVDHAASIVGCRSRAEDVVQDAWLHLERAAQQQTLRRPLHYLYRIVRNLAIDGRRRAHREARVVSSGVDSDTVADKTPSPEAVAASREELRLLLDAMADLPERTRLALEMHRLGGHGLKDIAARLGVSVTTAHEIIAKGLAHCQRRLHPPA
ncbi:sigma-70 family RNA polymerase sigma factor [Reyranella sp. CPCC 100927]|uniref:sigma-70 family RNA polymerase sigma factor n=1 Tax=Reyranella sp. CPCC 100927 TaxID=2599616 RepID=UPI0011B3B92E|nr:sigma-70 family RNA polymerase sigma factor [Reyranella sp. CPCC 100927]TWT15191.1 sigma-70 family RNA polymerase sigma factor [Reyranella sp. CPCC 100927]